MSVALPEVARRLLWPEVAGLEGAFATWVRPWVERFVYALALCYGGLALVLLWPVDLVTLGPGEREAFGWLRGSNALICAVSAAGLSTGVVGRRVGAWGAVTIVALTGVGAYHAAGLPHDPFYWPGAFAPIGAGLTMGRTGGRLALSLGLGVLHNAVWYGRRPGDLDAPSTWPSLAVFATALLLGFAITQAVYVIAWKVFCDEREIEARRAEVAGFNQRLEAEVREKTAEVRRLAQRATRLLEDERRRLSSELHDELGQTLTALRLEVAMLERGASAKSSARALHAQIDELFASVRWLVSSLRPKALEERGLVSACEWLVERFSTRGGTDIDARIDDVSPLGEDESLAVYRVLQEALTNVARHAEASHVDVTLSREGDLVRLTIVDDGVGFDPDAQAEGNGVMAMRERAQGVGGELRIERREQGMALTMTVPAGVVR